MQLKSSIYFCILLLWFIVSSCKKNETAIYTPNTENKAVAYVSIAASSSSLKQGHVLQLAAVAKDTFGNVLSDKLFAWTSLDPGVASVKNGTVSGNYPGISSITAKCEGKSSSVEITVEQK